MKVIHKIKSIVRWIRSFDDRLQKIQQALGRIEGRQLNATPPAKFNDYEYQVYSQWGEDGLIQYIINSISIDRSIFVEFGVERNTECNTRFLLLNNNWSGLVIDGSEQNIEYIKNDPIYWRHNLKAECAFITKNNINELIRKNGISGDIGLLSVDIDGNDYWIWEAINVVNPRIVICEYNSLWGPELAVTTPYDPSFVRTKAHYSNLYYGASIKAFSELATSKGYSLIGSNKAGNNIFFVRNDLIGNFEVVDPQKAWIQSQFKEARGESGELTQLEFIERRDQLSELKLINLADGKDYKVSELYDKNFKKDALNKHFSSD